MSIRRLQMNHAKIVVLYPTLIIMFDITAIILLILLCFHLFAGTYCPLGSERPTPCPAGKYCALHGLSLPSGLCKMGFFCNGSDVVEDPTPCAKGYYCPQGTPVQESCHPGTFNGKWPAETSKGRIPMNLMPSPALSHSPVTNCNCIMLLYVHFYW